MAVREEHNNASKWMAVVFSSQKYWEFIYFFKSDVFEQFYEEIFEFMLTFQCSTPSSNICQYIFFKLY